MFKKFVNLLTFWVKHTVSQCLKITKIVSFYIASEASYVCNILKCPKNDQFGDFLKTETCVQTVLPDGSTLIGQKLVETAKIQKFQKGHFGQFS